MIGKRVPFIAGLFAASVLLFALTGCPSGPRLALFPAAFNFVDDATSDVLTISNDGSGVLNWQITQIPAWLTVTPAQGTTTNVSAQVSLNINAAALPAGAVSDKIVITSNGGTQEVPIAVTPSTTTADPELSVSATTLDFGDGETALPLTIQNVGEGSLTWNLTEAIPWLTLSVASGSTTTESDVVTFTVSRAGLAAGPHSGTVSVTSNGGNASISVSINVAEAAPVLQVLPSPLQIAADASEAAVSVTNVGTGSLTWSVAPSVPWLSLDVSNGDTTSETDVIVVSVDRSQLVEGENAGQLAFTSDGGDFNLNVSVTAAPAALSVLPLSINFGSYSSEKLITIANAGVGTLAWEIDQSTLPAEGWLSADRYSGNATSQATPVLFHADRSPNGTPLSPGTYTAAVKITSAHGEATLNVVMTVAATPVLALKRSLDGAASTLLSLGFGLSETELEFYVLNVGSGTLEWNVTKESVPTWLTLTKYNDSVAAGGYSFIRATVDRTLVAPYGESYSMVFNTNTVGTGTINFSVGTEQKPSIAALPSKIDLGFDLDTTIVDIYNDGPVTTLLTFRVESEADWLSAGPLTGQSEGRDGPLKDYYPIGIAVNRSKLDSDAPTGILRVYALDDQGNDDLSIEPLAVEVTVKAPDLSFDVQRPKLLVPSAVRWTAIMRDFRDRAITMTPAQVLSLNNSKAFRIIEDGIELESTETNWFVRPTQTIRSSLVILLDYSGSMQAAAATVAGLSAQDPLQDAYEQAVGAFLDSLNNVPGQYSVSLMELHDRNNDATVVQPFTLNFDQIKTALHNLKIDVHGATELLPALQLARQSLVQKDTLSGDDYAAVDMRNILLISDGRRTTPPGEVTDALTDLNDDRVRVFTAGWGVDVSRETLINIGSGTGGYYYDAPENADETPNLANLLYRLTYRTPVTSTDPEASRPITLPNDLSAQIALGYVTLNETATVPTRFAASFRDPIDDSNSPIISGSSGEENLKVGDVVGDSRIGHLILVSSGINAAGAATVELKTEFTPRNVNVIQFTISSPQSFTFALTPEEAGGVASNWSLSSVVDATGSGVYTLTAPTNTVMPYGAFGSIGKLTYTGLAAASFTVDFTVDNAVYAAGPDAPSFLAPASVSVDPL